VEGCAQDTNRVIDFAFTGHLGVRPFPPHTPPPSGHALQVADALSLQFRLPPPGVPPPLPRASQDVLGGCPCVDALLLTSVWAVAALRQLAQVRQDQGFRVLRFRVMFRVKGPNP